MRLKGMKVLRHYQHHQHFFLQSCFETLYCESSIQINLARLIWLIYSWFAIFLQKCNYVLLKNYKRSTQIGWSIQSKLLQEFSFGHVFLISPAFLDECELTGENLLAVLLLPDLYHGDISMAFPAFLLHPHLPYPKDFPRWAWTYFGFSKRFHSLSRELNGHWFISLASVLFLH